MPLSIVSAQTITRPNDATAYAAGDLVANSTTAGSVTPFIFPMPTGPFVIKAARLTKSDQTDVALSAFRIMLFDTLSPTVTNGDNGAIAGNFVGAGWIGSVTYNTLMIAGSDDAIDVINLTEGQWIRSTLNAGKFLYGLLEARAAYVPAALETFTPALFVEYGPNL